MVLEHRTEPLLSRRRFALRLLGRVAIASAMVFASLGLGTIGYHFTEGFDWIDSLLNAAMILTGMGPADPLRTTPGKLFATAYALFSGIVFLTTSALVLGPVLHRLIHRFHFEQDADDSRG